MKHLLARLSWLSFLASVSLHAQPNDGDLVLSTHGLASGKGTVVWLDPRSSAPISTLTVSAGFGQSPVTMTLAPGNDGVMIGESYGAVASDLVEIDRYGVRTTLTTLLPGSADGLELDGDGNWIATSWDGYSTRTPVLGIHGTTGAVATITLMHNDPSTVAIVREAGVSFALTRLTTFDSYLVKVYGVDDSGAMTPLFASSGNPLRTLLDIAFDPVTGDLITVDADGPTSARPEPNGVEVNRVSLTGVVTTLVSVPRVQRCTIAQDRTLWLTGFDSAGAVRLTRVDLRTGAVVSTHDLRQRGLQQGATAIEVYGSRVVRCVGRGGPGAKIAIHVSSRRAAAAGAIYQLACSFGRRPGIAFANGERLALDVTSPLFSLSAGGALPTMFRAFTGRLGAGGTAGASVQLPPGIPANLGITVFCAGVIHDGTKVVQATNTHWFTL